MRYMSRHPIASFVVLMYLGLHAFTIYVGFDLFVVVLTAAFALGLVVRRWWASLVPLLPLVPAPLVLALSSDDPSAELDDFGVFVLELAFTLSAGVAAAIGFAAAYALRARAS
jgi:hypothetical protein